MQGTLKYFLVALLGMILIVLLSDCSTREVIVWKENNKSYRQMMIYAFNDSTAYAKFAMIRWGDSSQVKYWDEIMRECDD